MATPGKTARFVGLACLVGFAAAWLAIWELVEHREELLLRHGELVRRNDELDGELEGAHRLLARAREETATALESGAALEAAAREGALARCRSHAYQLQAAEIALESSRLARAEVLLSGVPEGERGLAWRLLRTSLGRRFLRVVDTEDDVLTLSTAPDQEILAVGTREGRLAGYPLPVPGGEAAEPTFVIEASEEAVFATAYSPGGEWVASGDLAGLVAVFEVRTGERIASFDFGETVSALAFLDEEKLVIGGDDGRLGILELVGGELLELGGHDRTINAIEVDRERRRLATASDDSLARVWMGEDFGRMVELQGHGDWVRDVAFVPGGERIVSASSDLTIRTWEVATGQELSSVSTSGVEVVGLAYGAGGESWCAYGRFGELLFERTGARIEHDVPLVGGIAVLAGASAADLSWVALAMGGAAALWRVDAGPGFEERRAELGEVRGLASTPDGARVLAGGADGSVWLFEGRVARAIGQHRGACMGVAISASGEVCASGGRDGIARIFDLPPGEEGVRERLAIRVDEKPVIGVALSPGLERLVCVTREGLMRAYDTGSGELLSELPAPRTGIAAATLSRDGELLAWIGDGGTIRTWDTRTGERVHPLRDRDLGRAATISLAERGLRLACSNNDTTAHVYDLETKERICVVNDPDHSIWSLALDAEGKLLATASRSGRVQLWDVECGEKLLTLRGRYEAVLALEFRRDGGALLAGTDGGGVEIWRAEVDEGD